MGAAAAGGATAFAQSLADFGMQQVQKGINAKEASKARKHQIFMRATAYQTAAKDLEKAGLNRILALGGPARAEGGPQASVGPASRGGKGENLFLSEKQAQALDAQIGATNALALKHAADTRGIDLDNIDKAEYTKWLQENPGVRRIGYARKSAGIPGAVYTTAKDLMKGQGGFEGVTKKLFPTYYKTRNQLKNKSSGPRFIKKPPYLNKGGN